MVDLAAPEPPLDTPELLELLLEPPQPDSTQTAAAIAKIRTATKLKIPCR